jgi:drug/metabolite transporter (DMT)-like permease
MVAAKALPRQMRLAGLGYMCVAMLLWAVIECIPQFFSQHYTSYQIVWLRYGTHLLSMLIVFGPRYKARLIRTKHLVLQLTRALLMMGMHLCFIWAIRRVAARDAMAIFWVSPVLLMGLAVRICERVRPAYWIVTLLALTGVLIMLQPSELPFSLATIFALGMGVCFSLYQLTSRLMLDEHILASLFYTALGVWVPLTVLMPSHWVPPTLHDLGLMAAIGLLGLGTLYALDRALESVSAPVVAPFSFSQVVFGVIASWVLLGLAPNGLTFVGGVSVMGCLLVLGWLARSGRAVKSDVSG